MKCTKYFLFAVLLLLSGIRAMAQINWGYSDNTIVSGIGVSEEAVMSGAIYIPAEVSELYKGKQITALRVGLRSSVTDLTIFVTKELDGEPAVATTLGACNSGLASYNLEESYTLDGEPFYVGYTCAGFNAIGCSGIFHPNGCWIKEGSGSWEDYATDPMRQYNALNLAMRIEGEDMPLDARILNQGAVTVKPNEAVKVSYKIENLSTVALKKFQFSYTVDEQEPVTVDMSAYIATNSSSKFSVDIPAFPESGVHTVTFNLHSINGESDAYAGNNTTSSQINVTELFFQKRMVVEEGTGTWCRYCPKGIVAFEEMHKKYPDNFIGIAVHYSDPMAEDTYSAIHSYFNGYPSCIINRDPSMVTEVDAANLEAYYKKIEAQYADAEVRVSAYLNPEDQGQVCAEAKVRFAYNNDNADYRMAFVVLEDSVTGYAQNNIYSGGSEPMGGFEDLPSTVSIPFYHVARGIYDYQGIPGTLPTTVQEGEYYEVQRNLELKGIQRNTKLSVVALLFNGRTGIIENADKCYVSLEPTGITSQVTEDVTLYVVDGTVACSQECVALEVFDTTGRRVANAGLKPGLYIVRCTLSGNKTVIKKIIV